MKRGAIVMCGGESTRMGQPKALLPFGPERMLQRVVRLASEAVPRENIVVVGAVGQELPPLPGDVAVTHDRTSNRGPLEGLARGLAVLESRVDVAYATGCDVPLLVPEFIERIFKLLGDYDIAIPVDEEFHHTLAAVYRVDVLPRIEQLLAADRLRPAYLFEQSDTLEVPTEELRSADPDLFTLRNVNTLAEYRAALQTAGF